MSILNIKETHDRLVASVETLLMSQTSISGLEHAAVVRECRKAFMNILSDQAHAASDNLADALVELAGPVGRPVNLGNNELLVEETTLNKVGLILVKAKGTRTPIPVEHERNVVGEVIQVEGPSLFMTWWPAYGEAPHPGDFLFMRLNVAKSEEVLVDEDR